MSPNFLPDSFVVAIQYPWQRHREGEVVLVRHHRYGKMIKRVAQVCPNGLLLVGDNVASVSTQDIGVVAFADVLGKVIFKVNPPIR